MATKKEKPVVETKKKTTRKTYKKIRSSPRQLKAAEKIVENNGKSLRQNILDAGYSQSTADNPDRLLGTKTMKRLLRAGGVDEEMVVSKIKEHINHHTIQRIELPGNPKKGDIIKLITDNLVGYKYLSHIYSKEPLTQLPICIVRIAVPEVRAQDKALDKAIKILDGYAPEKHDIGNFSLMDLFNKKPK